MQEEQEKTSQESTAKTPVATLPFAAISQQNKQRLAAIGKANDATLDMLLTAYEQRNSSVNAEIGTEVQTLLNENSRLVAELNAAKESVNHGVQKQREQEESLKKTATTLQNIEDKLKTTEKTLQEKETLIEKMKADMLAMNKETGIDSKVIDNLNAEIATLKNAVAAAEQQKKEDRKVIDGLQAAKKECEKIIEQQKAELNELKNAYLKLETNNGEPVINNYAEGDILHYFPALTARYLEIYADRLTHKRKDGKQITPAMILGDMFNRYIIDRFNLWFFQWQMNDQELVNIAKTFDERINSVKMLRAALGIK